MSLSLNFLMLSAAVAAGGSAAASEAKTAMWTDQDRVVFLGDSITDGGTLLLLVEQALRQAGRPVPEFVNAGVASDTAAMMRARLDRDVFPFKPTCMVISAGANDVVRMVSPEVFASELSGILKAAKAHEAQVVLLTTTIVGPKYADNEHLRVQYHERIHGLAQSFGCPVAEVHARMSAARDRGESELLSPDDIHLYFTGYRWMARAVLDAAGYAEVAVPEKLICTPYPGLVRDWLVRIAPDPKQTLDAAAAQSLKPDENWKSIELPMRAEPENFWYAQELERGAALLAPVLGKAPKYQAAATFTSPGARTVYLHTGGDLQSVWLNGTKVYQAGAWRGWKLGRESVEVELRAGANSLLIETGSVFILTLHPQRNPLRP